MTFPVLRAMQYHKQPSNKLIKPRSMAIVYLGKETLGYRFRLRSLKTVASWNKDLKASGMLKRVMEDEERLQPYARKNSDSDIFFIFATLSK